ncbi:pyruvate, water dikinase [Desulfonispora thiosulfatigenes DSM 11270]|uniref:Pyruvate, water dikinase n=1 Tax=Desulfonispora thiosulfatigenes DSM 11270 TaxID=656914 RepID=A0A1W1VBC3_DESTI|nr:PEP/pyruvate-binding domain-containing protein [Desulfonispora thiosulfatigenes]SMB90274.1 pyruvate, water dikinase [Desulfonispora thiosulfatigenes DSM 11270]
MNKKIYPFTNKDIPPLSVVGGKAKALIETSRAGFPVPEGFVLSVEFFSPWLKEIKSSSEWSELLLNVTRQQCDIVKSKARKLIFDEWQKLELDKVLSNFKTGIPFAVRSSSPEEDLEGTSFAGMYETSLGIKAEELEKNIASAFSSCFDFRVIEYKRKNKVNLENTQIAVIVQRQIASDVSGVGFSLNPTNNSYDEVMINASFGLGESIVSGIVTPDTYVVDSVKNEIIEKRIGDKQSALWIKSEGGIIKKDTNNCNEQALTDEQIFELTDLIKKCERYYEKPMDTEWAFEENKLYLLQSRPITTYLSLFPELLTKPGEMKKIYIDVMGLTQGFTESMSVLGMEIWTRVVDELKGDIMPSSIDGIMPALHGRQYINVSNCIAAWGLFATKQFLKKYDDNVKKIFSDIDLAREYKPAKTPENLKNLKFGMLKMVFPMIPSTIKAKFSDYKEVVNEYNSTASNIFSHIKILKSDKGFSEIVDLAIKDLETIMNKMGITIAGMSAFASIKRMFKSKDVEKLVIALGMDLEGNPTSQMGHLLFKLASYDDFQKTKSVEEFLVKVKEKSYSIEFMKDYEEYLNKFGARGFMEIDVASKRVYEDPRLLYEKLININIKDSQILNVKTKREEAYNKLLAVAKEGGFDKKFEKQAEIYQATFGYREHPKYVIVMICAKLHDIALEIGEKFVQEGILDDKWHIFDLHSKDITNAQKDEKIDLKAIRDRNLAPYKKVAHIKDWPLVIDSRGKIFKPKINAEDGDLLGTAIAPGIARGRAKLLRMPYEKPLNPGEILVAKATEPSWTPIFINAAGVIMEVGGPLQHGGIIAREYGIPCVSGMLGIMDIIKDGDLLEVDGSNGIVRIIEVGKKTYR